MADEPEAPDNLSNKVMIAKLIEIEKDLRKLSEITMVLVHQTIQGNKLAKKGLFLQFNVKDLTLPEIDEEYAAVKKQLEEHTDDAKNLAKKLMMEYKENV